MSKADLARARWLESKNRADEAQEAARVATDEAYQRYADYAEVDHPGFANFFRRVLTRLPIHEDKGEQE